MAVRNFIGMSTPKAVSASQHLHPTGHFAMKRVAAMGKGGCHMGSVYLYSMIGKGGVQAKCNLDLLDSIAFTLSGLVGPWCLGGTGTAHPTSCE